MSLRSRVYEGEAISKIDKDCHVATLLAMTKKEIYDRSLATILQNH